MNDKPAHTKSPHETRTLIFEKVKILHFLHICLTGFKKAGGTPIAIALTINK